MFKTYQNFYKRWNYFENMNDQQQNILLNLILTA